MNTTCSVTQFTAFLVASGVSGVLVFSHQPRATEPSKTHRENTMNSTDIQASLSNILDRLGNLLTDGEKDALYEVIDGVQDGLFDDRF